MVKSTSLSISRGERAEHRSPASTDVTPRIGASGLYIRRDLHIGREPGTDNSLPVLRSAFPIPAMTVTRPISHPDHPSLAPSLKPAEKTAFSRALPKFPVFPEPGGAFLQGHRENPTLPLRNKERGGDGLSFKPLSRDPHPNLHVEKE